MRVERLQKLTGAQREALRLVMAGYKSKEIAHQLGVTEDAINKRLAAAMATLEAPSRFVAARQLAAWEEGEGQEPSHSLVGKSLALEPVNTPPMIGGPPTPENRDEDARAGRVEEARAAYGVAPNDVSAISPTADALAASSDQPAPIVTHRSAFTAMVLTGALIALVQAFLRLLGAIA